MLLLRLIFSDLAKIRWQPIIDPLGKLLGFQLTFGSTGWSNPSGLNLVTTYVVDNLGRTTKTVENYVAHLVRGAPQALAYQVPR